LIAQDAYFTMDRRIFISMYTYISVIVRAFDNAIVTDGISIGFQITEKDKRKRKEYKNKKTENEKENDTLRSL